VDYHKDHLLVANGVLECAQRHSSVEQLLLFETWCPVVATHVVDVTQVMELKIQALERHHSALKYGDYARCIRALNAYRGLYLGRDCYAEAFGVQSLPMGKTQALDLAVFQKLGMTLKRALSKTL
jgi:LmbE family N-acetylglucosaminyl deacetylase